MPKTPVEPPNAPPNRALTVRSENELAPRSDSASTVGPASMYLASLVAGSRPAQASALRMMFGEDPDAFPWSDFDFAHAQLIRSRLLEWQSERTGEPYAPATINRMLFAMRGVARMAWRLKLIDSDTFMRISDLDGIRGSRVLAGRMLSEDEIDKVFHTADDLAGPVALRDAAILAAFAGGGLRRVEVATLKLSQFKSNELTVIGKGNKERIVPIPAEAADIIRKWVKRRGDWAGPLFTQFHKGGKLTNEGISISGVSFIIDKLLGESGIKNASTHDFRRTYISNSLDDGADLATVAGIVGHSDVSTTAKYDRRGEKAKRAVADRVRLRK